MIAERRQEIQRLRSDPSYRNEVEEGGQNPDTLVMQMERGIAAWQDEIRWPQIVDSLSAVIEDRIRLRTRQLDGEVVLDDLGSEEIREGIAQLEKALQSLRASTDSAPPPPFFPMPPRTR